MPYDDAARFLAQAVPWPDPTKEPPEFFVNIVHPAQRGWGGRAARTLREALSYLRFPVETLKTDVYVCMSGQKLPGKAKVDKRGNPYFSAARSIPNAHLHKSFYADIDLKPEGFTTTKAALDGVGQFCDATDLPMPSLIVLTGSGGGHIHWTLDEPITHDRWQPLAGALVAALRAHKFVIDFGCSTDAARVLRIPDTFNYKPTREKVPRPEHPVKLLHAGHPYLIERIEAPLRPYLGLTPTPPPAKTHHVVSLPANLGPISKLATFKEMVPNQQHVSLSDLERCCPFIEKAHITGGKDYAQPLWWETAKIAFYTKEGFAALKHMADGHALYNEQDNQDLFDRVCRERGTTDIYGWPLCDTIRDAGALECPACPWRHAGRTGGKSPFHFLGEDHKNPGSPPPPSSPSSPSPPSGGNPAGNLPVPYQHDADFKIFYETQDDDGNTVKEYVSPYPMRNFVPVQDGKISFEIIIDQRGWIPVEIPTKAVSRASSFSDPAGDQLIMLHDHEQKRVRSLLISFVQQLLAMKQNSVAPMPFGWVIDEEGKPDGFVYARTRFNCKGDTPAAISDRMLAQWYEPRGDIERWKAGMKMINDQHRPELEAIVAASFGAVFMEFTSERGLLVSAYSPDSGVYKSSAMRVAQAVWSNPQKTLQRLDDTENSVIKKLGDVQNLPVLWDELKTEVDARKYSGIIHGLPQGKGKSRLNRNSTQQDVGTWATLLIAATNSSLLSIAKEQSLTSPAGMYRVLEFEVGKPSVRIDDADKILFAVDHNYGLAGREFARWLGANGASLHDIVHNSIQMVRKDFKSTSAERFWVVGIAVIILAAQVTNKLKLANFDVDALYAFLKSNFIKLQRSVGSSGSLINDVQTLVEFLASLLNSTPRSTVYTDNCTVHGGRPMAVALKGATIEHQSKQFIAQVATGMKLVRISRAAVGVFAKQQGMDSRLLYDKIENVLGAKVVRHSLAAGTPLSKANERLFEIDLTSKPELQVLFET